jgi:hypothetical protein
MDRDTDQAEFIPFDQRGNGFPRVQDSAVDIGAFEFLNALPTSDSVTPATGSSNISVTRTLAVTYTDADGPGDIAEVRLLVNDTNSEANGFCAIYDRLARKLYLLDDDGVTRKGGFGASTINTISNSQGTINCKVVTSRTSGNSYTLVWNFTPSPSFKGTKNLYAQVTDKSKATETYKKLGDWTINGNSEPVNVSLFPTASNTLTDRLRTFTTTYADAEGAVDISEVRFLVSDTTSTANALCVIYERATKKVYLLDDDGVTRKGGFPGGSDNVISNSQGSIDCKTVSVSMQGSKLTLRSNLTPNGSFTGQKNLYSYVVDKYGASDDLEDLGDWTIRAPAVGISGQFAAQPKESAGKS